MVNYVQKHFFLFEGTQHIPSPPRCASAIKTQMLYTSIMKNRIPGQTELKIDKATCILEKILHHHIPSGYKIISKYNADKTLISSNIRYP